LGCCQATLLASDSKKGTLEMNILVELCAAVLMSDPSCPLRFGIVGPLARAPPRKQRICFFVCPSARPVQQQQQQQQQQRWHVAPPHHQCERRRIFCRHRRRRRLLPAEKQDWESIDPSIDSSIAFLSCGALTTMKRVANEGRQPHQEDGEDKSMTDHSAPPTTMLTNE